MFSLFNGLYLRPLPFHHPEQLVNLDEVAPKWNLEYTGLAYPDLCEWRAQNKTFESMGAWDDERFNFSLNGNPQRIEGGRATHDLFKVLGIQPILGRTFTSEEDQPGAVRVALIGCRFWKSFWAGENNIVGQTISLDSVPHTVVGVLPRDLGPLERADVVTPLRLSPNDSSGWFLSGIGRL